MDPECQSHFSIGHILPIARDPEIVYIYVDFFILLDTKISIKLIYFLYLAFEQGRGILGSALATSS